MSAPQLPNPHPHVPAADVALDVDPDRRAWLRLRRTGLGSSDISTLVGLNRYRSPYELWMDKTGQLPLLDDAPSEAAEMGTLLEPVVRDRFARHHDLTVTRVGTYRSVEWPFMLANPDGLCSDGHGYEGKTCSAWLGHEWADGQTADHAELQAQWGMAVTGLHGWHVAVLIGGQRNEYRHVARDDELIAVLVDAARRFWHDHVLTGTPPAWDGSEAATGLLRERYPAGDVDSIVDIDPGERDELTALRDQTSTAAKAAAAEEDAVKNRVRGLLGDRERLMCGDQEVATWRNTGPFSEKRFTAAHPEVAARYTRPVTVHRVDVDALAADHPELHRAFRARRLEFKH